METTIHQKNYKTNIYKFYIFSFILGIHTVRAVYIPYMMGWGGLSFFQVMILQSYFMFMIFLLEIPSGAIADHIGRNVALMLSGLSVVGAAFTYSIIPNIFLFFLAETLWAFSSALFSGTDQAFLFNTLKTMKKEENLPNILGRIQTIRLIALTLSAPLGSIIAEYVSLQFSMICLGFVYIGAFFISLTFKEPRVENEKISQKYLTILKEGFRELRENKIMRILCFDRVFIGVLTYFLFWTYQIYLGVVGIPILWFGFITASMNIINMIFTILIPMFVKHFKKKLLFLIFVDSLIGIAYILLGFATNTIMGILLLLVIVAFGYPRFLIYVNGINRQIASENRATVLSTINMFGSLLMAISYPFIGLLVEWNPFVVFILIGVLILFFTTLTRVKNEYL
ncbi:MAG: MFS transporter [Candidatus Lokiarchaeota archaeon]|nr:MFS transporter [Candidatus Lokiarchaeota archaeon]